MFVLKSKRILIIALVAVFALLAVVISSNVGAQQESGNGLRISPPRVEMSVFPGNSEVFTIEVTNVTADPLVAITTVDNFVSEDEAGTPQLNIDENFNPPYSIDPFISGLEDLPLQPGETKKLNVGVDIPSNASPGGYYGLVRFTAVPEGAEDATGVALSASIGTIVLIEVPGDIIQLMSLEELSAAKDNSPELSETSSFFSKAPEYSVVRLKNEGNSFLQPFGKIVVKDWGGNIIYDYELNNNEPRGNVLPDTIRRFEDKIENVGWFGKYTIEANIGYGDGGGNIITATSTFWVVPWKHILVAVVVVGGALFAGTKGVKMYNRHIIEKSKKR